MRAIGRIAALALSGLVAVTLLSACSATRVQAGRSSAPARNSSRGSADRHPSAAETTHKSPPPFGVLIAVSKVPSLPVSTIPGAAPTQTLANPNDLGAPLVLLVNAVRGEWVQVFLPERPNESLGWVRSADVSTTRDPERIIVDLSTRHLWLLRDNRTVFQAPVAVGSPSSPTPTGDFFVTEVLKVVGADNPYGPYALGLSGFSNTYYSFEGGPGQIAIHGTDQPWVIGQYASHGCVRLDNADISALATQVEAGTPVDIVS